MQTRISRTPSQAPAVRYGAKKREANPRPPQRGVPAGRVAAFADASPQVVHRVAREASRSPSQPLPYFDAIQRSFGRHDVGRVRAHTGAAASAGAEAIGAEAFTRGSHIVFRGAPDLRTAAHEAAHAIQQRSGVRLSDGVGRRGDRYERHAEQVADTVLRGGSAEALLDRFASGPAAAVPPAGVQRIVRKGRNGKYHSTLDEGRREFDNEDDARELDERLQAARTAKRETVSQQLAQMDFTPPNLGEGRLSEAATPLAVTLGSHPAHFGPLMTQGGQVPTSAVSRAQGTALQSPGQEPGADKTYHSGQNTYAAIFGSTSVGDVPVSESVANKSGGMTPIADLSRDVANAGREFRDQHIFQQGTVQEDENVSMPPGRTYAHAEAKAARSQAMTGAIQNVGNSLTGLIKAVGGAQDLPREPKSEEGWEALYATLGLLPQGNVTIAENRSSCPSGSGYPGGCNQEMADLVPEHWKTHEANVGENPAAMHRALNLMNFGMSAAGPYGKGGNPAVPIESGMDVSVHNKMSWDPGSEGQLKPLDSSQKEFLAKIAVGESKRRQYMPDPESVEEESEPKSAAARKTKAKKGSSSSVKEEAPSWGGSGPDSTEPFQNWGANHPLHKRRFRDDDGNAT